MKQEKVDKVWEEYKKIEERAWTEYNKIRGKAIKKLEKKIQEFETKSTDIELKTLKDIHMEGYMRLIIKKEAIKWVKADCDFNDWRVLFKKFFNITEEDLE